MPQLLIWSEQSNCPVPPTYNRNPSVTSFSHRKGLSYGSAILHSALSYQKIKIAPSVNLLTPSPNHYIFGGDFLGTNEPVKHLQMGSEDPHWYECWARLILLLSQPNSIVKIGKGWHHLKSINMYK